MLRRFFCRILLLFAVALATVLALCAGLAVAANGNGAGLQRVPVLIGFHQVPGPSEQALVHSHGGAINYSYTLVPAIAAWIPEPAIDGLLHNPNVTIVEPDIEVFAVDTELDNTWGVKRIGAGTVHDGGNKGTGVKVAVIDSGIDYNHGDLNGNYAGGYDFVNNDSNPMDDNGHGTHVAGTVAALDNDLGVVGVAPEASLYALKVLDSQGSGRYSDVIAALQWAVNNGIRVTNNSYGSSGDPGSTVRAAFNNAAAAGILNVCAAGNSSGAVIYPAKYSSCVAVAATDQYDKQASFSCFGPEVELAAPGVGINSTVMGGGYEAWSGTSMATPHVTGTAALVIFSGVTGAADIRARLTSTADDLGAPGRDVIYGYGLVNAAAAAGGTVPPPPPPPPVGTVSVASISYKTNNRDLLVTVALVDNLGRVVGGASVSVELRRNSSYYGRATGTTGSNGKVTFTLKNAPSGTYTTIVTNVSATGLTWIGGTPSNSFKKR